MDSSWKSSGKPFVSSLSLLGELGGSLVDPETPSSTAASRPATPESSSLMSLLDSFDTPDNSVDVRALQLLIDSLSVSDDLPPGLCTPTPSIPTTPTPTTSTTTSGGSELGLKQSDTTMMLRNVPYEARQEGVLRVLEQSPFKGRFSFFYCPLDFRSLNNLGYAFINLESPDTALDFVKYFDGRRIDLTTTTTTTTTTTGGSASGGWEKPLRVSRARIQGYTANVEHYRNSPVNLKTEEFKPMIFGPKPQHHKLPFPAPNAPVQTPPSSTGGGTLRPRERRLHAKTQSAGNAGGAGSRVFVGGLGGETDSMSLWEYMAQFGRVMDAQVLIDPGTGKSRNYGFCTFAEAGSATKALEKNQHTLDGREIVVRKYTSNK